MQTLELSTQEFEQFDTLVVDDGIEVEVKRPREKARQGVTIYGCRHCGYEGSAELGLAPRPSTRAAEFCPSCRGAV